ncbi:PREDICTED: uncharacterized protein LOC107345966 isoform X4 [Acropora digitifera]|uniref:uncharacterized protein LOC107345966 isoform X4 n=1 Tax=Acropora digitifera TaxID=70779 RepID=UPI00077A6B5D|nr:PREDICTED: uncharacterized protein LOC107345966 isoform X4 [Acropora digitifera]
MDTTGSNQMMISEEGAKVKKLGKARIVTLILLAVAVIFLVVGIVLISVASSKKEGQHVKSGSGDAQRGNGEKPTSAKPTSANQTFAKPTSTKPTSAPTETSCAFSEEAQRTGLHEFLSRVKNTYYKLHPYDIYYDPDVTTSRIKEEYVAYDPTPSVIKKRTDAALDLLKEISSKSIDTDKLKPRERKSLAQVKHYLQHVFGQPYDVNYYAGDWMLGPNLFCWQEICSHGYGIYNGIGLNQNPRNVSDVNLIETKLKTHKEGILQYIENVKMGVKIGMVRSVEECKAGLNAISRRYLNVSLHNETGVLQEWYVAPLLAADFYVGITEEIDNQWKSTHDGKNVEETVKDWLVKYIGDPINQMLRYLKLEHSRHCVPSNVSSGLASLPLKYIWLDGQTNMSFPTTQTLPTGERLNGPWAYSQILSYFTTNQMTPLEVHELGKKQLDILYPKILEVAREVTGEENNATAVEKFREKINSPENYFNSEPIPKNESDEEAHKKCSDIEGAKKYCPKRWAAMQLWFSESRKVMSLLEPKTIPLFYFTGDNATTPTCPVDMRPDLNPSSGAQSYSPSDAICSRSAKYYIPFFLENLGPRFSEWTVTAHETRPGHHTQVQGNIEHFGDNCGGVIEWINLNPKYGAFTEGWALYAENPLIAQYTDAYNNEPMQKFGMLKWQVWRAVRLIVDTGLHYVGMSRDQALKYLSDYAWDDTDLAKKEVTRYQSVPGQATAYMIGKLEIEKASKYASDQLGDKFSLKDFHYQVLKQGFSPLAYLTEHVEKYVGCVKDTTKEGCDVILQPTKKTESTAARTKRARWPFISKETGHEHYI